MTDILTLHTSVTTSLLHQTLIKGFFPALLGGLIIVSGGIFLPPSLLNYWGFPVFLAGIFSITYGLLPYRRLTILAGRPDMLKVIGLDSLEFYSKGHKILTIPFKGIKKITYFKNNQFYGIGLVLEPSEREFIVCPLELNGKQKKYRQYLNSDIFLPYFSRRSFEEFEDWQANGS
jgi:hypothetical protein